MSAASPADGAWIGIDLGTQSVRAIAVDSRGTVLASAAHPLVSHRSGSRHTQNPDSWWEAVRVCCRKLTETVAPESMCGLAVDATSGTILLTDETLRPVTEGLMYDDGRAAAEAAEVQEAGADLWAELGYRIQPSWALPKLLWLWHAARSSESRASETLKLTHQNDFIHLRLAGRRLASDWSHSLKSGYDLIRRAWPFDAIQALCLPESLFPSVVAPGTVIGQVSREAASECGLPPGLPIIAGMTDGCAAQIASGAIQTGSWNSVLGTTLVLKGVTATRLRDPSGVLYSHLSPTRTWLPGGASSTGAGLVASQFPAENLDRLTEQSTRRGPTPVVTYPLAARGERFPFLAPDAEGFTIGHTRDSAESYRSILQGVAFVERLSFDYVEMLGAPVGEVSISGGATRNMLWNRLRAGILGRPLKLAAISESAFGMAVLAASHEVSLEQAAKAMISPSRIIESEDDFASVYAEGYRALLLELKRRGWLPEPLANFSLTKLSSPTEAQV